MRRVEQQLINDVLVPHYKYTFFLLISGDIMLWTFYDVLFCIIFRSRNKEYIPIVGLADFNKLSAKLIFGADS